jgi:hypothetical protein
MWSRLTCFPVRPGIPLATTAHCLWPCSSTRWASRLSSSGVHLISFLRFRKDLWPSCSSELGLLDRERIVAGVSDMTPTALRLLGEHT